MGIFQVFIRPQARISPKPALLTGYEIDRRFTADVIKENGLPAVRNNIRQSMANHEARQAYASKEKPSLAFQYQPSGGASDQDMQANCAGNIGIYPADEGARQIIHSMYQTVHAGD
jgi:hypothetical protein